jgi:hypothetical protein
LNVFKVYFSAKSWFFLNINQDCCTVTKWKKTISLILRKVGLIFYANVKQSHYRSGEAPKVPGDGCYQISRQSAHEGGNVSPTHRPPLPPTPRNIPVTHFCYRLSQPQGHSGIGRIMSMKNLYDIILVELFQ